MVAVRVDRELCLESGQCARSVPTVFVLYDDGIAAVRGGGAGPTAVSDLDEQAVRRAAATCPAAAITIDEQP